MNKGISSWITGCLIVIALSWTGFALGPGSVSPKTEKLRQVTLKQVLKIEDDGETFYFKNPRSVATDSDQNIYIRDGIRLLKFSKDGEFLKNLVKGGQGPGEVTRVSGFQVTGKSIIIHNNNPSKIIWIDLDGNLQKEFRLKNTDYVEFSHFYKSRYYFFDTEMPDIKGEARLMDSNYNFFPVSDEGERERVLYSFPKLAYVAAFGDSKGQFPMVDFRYEILGGRYLFASHTGEYNIKIYDIEEKKITREFSIEYNRQKLPPNKRDPYKKIRIRLGGKTFRAPLKDYFEDVQCILIKDDQLWVITSTVDKENGIRVDVFSLDGKYTESFLLRLPGRQDVYRYRCCLSGQSLYFLDKNEDGEWSLIKYAL